MEFHAFNKQIDFSKGEEQSHFCKYKKIPLLKILEVWYTLHKEIKESKSPRIKGLGGILAFHYFLIFKF
nr:MAG TPA: hypothetical protein [Caudoviricetes sp.]